jgi:polysaccharide transporter, PST family
LAFRKFALDAFVLTVARIFQVAVNALALPVLARLLQPSDFGLMAAANSILFLATVLADAGFANSLVRTDFGDKKAWSSVFWFTAAWSAGLALLLAALAVPVAWALNEPNVAPLIEALAILPFGLGLLAAPTADLMQRARFGWIAASDILGSIAGIAAVCYFAAMGAGPWALVAQTLISLVVKAGVICASTRFRPILTFDINLVGEHLHFARNTGAFAVVLFLGTQMDNIMIARWAGAGPLGLYSMAYRIMNLPSALGSGIGALYPRLVKLQNDKHAMRQLVLITTTVLAIIIFPPMALLCAAGHAVFTVLLSDRWSEAATVFAYLAPVGALQAIGGIHTYVLMAVGRTDTRLRIAVEHVALWMIVLILVAPFGIRAVALGLTLSYLAYYPRFLVLFLTPMECPLLEYMLAMAIPLCVSIVFALGHLILRTHFSFVPIIETGVAAIETLGAYGMIAFLLRSDLSRALATMRVLIGNLEQ